MTSKDQIELFKNHFNRDCDKTFTYRLHRAITFTVDVLSRDEVLACCKALGISSVTTRLAYDGIYAGESGVSMEEVAQHFQEKDPSDPCFRRPFNIQGTITGRWTSPLSSIEEIPRGSKNNLPKERD